MERTRAYVNRDIIVQQYSVSKQAPRAKVARAARKAAAAAHAPTMPNAARAASAAPNQSSLLALAVHGHCQRVRQRGARGALRACAGWAAAPSAVAAGALR
jgi:hypothetical protein